ncbi:PQQ-binding-like beta-propeller repeat protein [Mucilaginibacter sabulilitoris]|uniref:PQQ-binding-like beta-propeller repeat protein n=1 Tax=Mucilaginibacter sabulilitoris TaxID=1173583 RepID=A0ABZ0THP5_9SPHI|nr:PQQ-binding-like beta-propeller repeat protein [Mucilaginibacter sabulilitoris]WPU92699.1 PQQ-binding-like beta-propeller repeat protein [Mucilaginibacter sabulilitoris]
MLIKLTLIKKLSTLVLILLLTVSIAKAQSFKFAFVSDTHVNIGNPTAAEDLRRTVRDINANNDLKFVVITGDITEFGADEEIKLAKQILDSLNKKWYIIPGNHDANWSESGSNTFKKIFGAETFAFNYGGYLFAGTSCGPNMRMGPGQVPRENIVWLDSVLNHTPATTPVVYLNHYPQDSSQNNWYTVINKLKTKNTQLILCGHGHNNHRYTFDGIPAVMGRSNLRAKDSIGGYNIVTFDNGKATFEERKPVIQTLRKWTEVDLFNHYFDKDTAHYYRPSYAVNNKPGVKVKWSYQDQSDVGAGMAIAGDKLILTDTKGLIYALNRNTGKRVWSYATGGKIYSTPYVSGNYVVAGSSDKYIYCISAVTGKLVWKSAAEKAVVASPVIKNNVVFIGASDGHFRAFQLTTGKLLWDFDQVKGFIVTRPLIYQDKIYFGCWANDFYALDIATGKLVWKWSNGSSNRMFSPAACYPVATGGRIFIVAPDQYMTSLDASTGKMQWRSRVPHNRVRESMGLSGDSSLVYAKTMDGQLLGISTKTDSLQIAWKASLQLPYELAPSAIVEDEGVIYVPTHSGIAYAVDRQSGNVLWKHKVSNCLVNPILPFHKTVYVSTMDGKIDCLQPIKNK